MSAHTQIASRGKAAPRAMPRSSSTSCGYARLLSAFSCANAARPSALEKFTRPRISALPSQPPIRDAASLPCCSPAS